MAQPPVHVPRPDDRLLLAQQGASALPSPIALQLLDVPFVLPLQKQPPRVDGRLPEACWRLEYELLAADRTRYRVRVTGDPVLGLPYGRDADVLLALFRIMDEGRDIHDLATGTFRQPSFQMICRALGLGATGPLVRRIRDALRRLANVRIESRSLVDRSAEAQQVLARNGVGVPSAPTAGTVRRHEIEESRWLLEYRTEERTETRAVETGDEHDVRTTGPALAVGMVDAAGGDESDGLRDSRESGARAPALVERTLWIHELRLNPFWVSQAISGWAGWIDVERHAELRSITARRLYQLCAAQAARHARLPWIFPEHDLRAACMLTTEGKKPTRVRQLLSEAAEELVQAGVLARHEWHGAPRRGAMEFVLEPGALLQLGGLLRGIGLTDPPDVRVQYALLRAFGVTAPKARTMIAQKPGQVAEVLLRACHLRATDPGEIAKSWAGWIIHHVESDTSFAGEVAFQKWRRSALAKLDRQVDDGRAAARRDGAASAIPHLPNGRRGDESLLPVTPEPARPAGDPAAATRWAQVLETVRPELSMLDYYGVEDAIPLMSDGEALVLGTTNDIAARALQRLVPRLEAVLSTIDGAPAGEGAVVRVVPVRPEGPLTAPGGP